MSARERFAPGQSDAEFIKDFNYGMALWMAHKAPVPWARIKAIEAEMRALGAERLQCAAQLPGHAARVAGYASIEPYVYVEAEQTGQDPDVLLAEKNAAMRASSPSAHFAQTPLNDDPEERP